FGALHKGNCLCASIAACLPSVMSCCVENIFQPGLSCVLCAKAPGAFSAAMTNAQAAHLAITAAVLFGVVMGPPEGSFLLLYLDGPKKKKARTGVSGPENVRSFS